MAQTFESLCLKKASGPDGFEMSTSKSSRGCRKAGLLSSLNVSVSDRLLLIGGMQPFCYPRKQKQSQSTDIVARDCEEKRLLQTFLISVWQ